MLILWLIAPPVFPRSVDVRIGQVVFTGETDDIKIIKSFPLATLEGKVYTEKRMDQYLQKLRAYFERLGYYGAAVGPPLRHFSSQLDTIDVTIPVVSSHRTVIQFDGLGPFSKEEIGPLLLIKEERSDDDFLLEESAHRIKDFYKTEGYPFVEVSVSATRTEKTVEARFSVVSGERVQVQKIEFLGNETFPEEELVPLLSHQTTGPLNAGWYIEKYLEEEKEALTAFYQREGFQEVVVTPKVSFDKDKTHATLTFTVQEGPRTRVGNVQLTGHQQLSADDLAGDLPVKPGAPYHPTLIQTGARWILANAAKHGYIHAHVDTFTLHDNSVIGAPGRADITYRIAEGDRVRLGKILLPDGLLTKERVIRREILLKEGDPYVPALLLQSQHNLYRRGYFQAVRFNPIAVDDKPAIQDLRLFLTERSPMSIEVGLGYGDQDRFRQFLEWSHQNLFGTGRSVTTRIQTSEIEKKYTLGYREPWFFTGTVDARMGLESEDTKKPTFNLHRLSGTFGVDKSFSSTTKGTLLYEYERSEALDVSPDVPLAPEDLGGVNIATLNTSLVRDTRDDPFNPRSGSLNGVTLRNGAHVLGSEVQLIKLTLQSRHYVSPTPGLTLGASARVGVAERFGQTDLIPFSERFLLGGGSTVRGYKRDQVGIEGETIIQGKPTGGNLLLNFNEEVRLSPTKLFGLVLFLDHGNVWGTYKTLRLSELKSTVGIGLRRQTPVGPFRVDFGYKLNREIGESAWGIHFDLGNVF